MGDLSECCTLLKIYVKNPYETQYGAESNIRSKIIMIIYHDVMLNANFALLVVIAFYICNFFFAVKLLFNT